ncbi:MAG: hypothetical protein HUU55_08625 [Myxococcales bacterium]|nr:hypothetical protein [Myxococcales bacterium]
MSFRQVTSNDSPSPVTRRTTDGSGSVSPLRTILALMVVILPLSIAACGDDETEDSSGLCAGASCGSTTLDPLGNIGTNDSDTPTGSESDAFASKDTTTVTTDTTGDSLTIDDAANPLTDITAQPDITTDDTAGQPDIATAADGGLDSQPEADTVVVDPIDVNQTADTSADTTTTDPDTFVPPDKITTCNGIIHCVSQCAPGDSLCHTACDAAATDDAKAALAAFESCSVNHCSNLAGEQYTQCMLVNCLDQTAPCWTGGTDSCADVYACAAQCGFNSPPGCGEQCIADASENGFKHFVDYMLCSQSKCNTPGGFCGIFGALTCHEQAVACGVYTGNGQCSDAIGCLTACTTNTCLWTCQTKLSANEAKTLADLVECVYVVCGPNPAPGCFESAATKQCQAFAIACYL